MPEEQVQAQSAPAATAEVSEFESLMNKEFKPKSAEAKSAVKLAVQTLAEQALASTTLISDNAVKTIEAIIAEIDRKLSEQINLILHHEDFKALEGSWRGLHYLVNNTETGENLKIRVMNISKKEVSKTLKKFKGTAWDQSPLFKKLYEEEFGIDRKSTRLNSSHSQISYAVFCLKKKNECELNRSPITQLSFLHYTDVFVHHLYNLCILFGSLFQIIVILLIRSTYFTCILSVIRP